MLDFGGTAALMMFLRLIIKLLQSLTEPGIRIHENHQCRPAFNVFVLNGMLYLPSGTSAWPVQLMIYEEDRNEADILEEQLRFRTGRYANQF